MPRYVGSHHKRGDVAEAPSWLKDEGLKLLGQLAARRHGGVSTLSLQREFEDGSRITASFFGDTPIVEYRVPPPGGRPGTFFGNLRGFVVGSSIHPGLGVTEIVYSPADFVLLDPTTTPDWSPYFYDSTRAPTAGRLYTVDSLGNAIFRDGTIHGDAPPYANGLMLHGNVDWRNNDESLIVSWLGPLSRYFTDAGTTSGFVFAHGQMVFDLALIDPALFGDLSDVSGGFASGAVTGACQVGLTLLVTIRFGTINDDSVTARREFLVQVTLRSEDARTDPAPRDSAHATVLHMTPATDTKAEGDPQILWSQDITLQNNEHPWFFNSNGTEARCIRYNATTHEAIECALKKTGTWAYSENANAGCVQTRTVTNDYDAKPWYAVASGYASTPFYSSTGLNDLCAFDMAIDEDLKETVTRTVSQVLIAVDYRADVPVYAYGIPEEYTDEYTANANPVQTSFDWTNPGDHMTGSNSGATAYSRTGVTGGIITDWMTLAGSYARTGSSSFTMTADWAITAGPSTSTITVTGGSSNTATDIFYQVLYLDLRTKWLAYEKRTLHDESTGVNQLGSLTYPGYVVQVVTDTVLNTFDYVTTLDGVTLANTNVIETSQTTISPITVNPLPTFGTTSVQEQTASVFAQLLATRAFTGLEAVPARPTDYPTHTDPNSCLTLYGAFPSSPPTASPYAGSFPVQTNDATESMFAQPWQHHTLYAWALPLTVVGPYVPPPPGNEITVYSTYGSWQSYKDHWVFSQAMPDGASIAASQNFVTQASDGQDITVLTAPPVGTLRYFPIFTLPEISY